MVVATSASPAAAAESVNGNITNFASLRCLDAKAEQLGRNGTEIQLWDCYGSGQLNQLWFKYIPGGTYRMQLRSRYDGRCLDADWQTIGSNGTNGTKVQLWDCYGAQQRNQLWYLELTPTFRVYQIRNVQSGRCLDADYHGIGGNGTRVQLWDCYGPGSHNQLWRLPGLDGW
jgi:hypothetical protein